MPDAILVDKLSEFILAAGGLGTAAFGLVEALKGASPLGLAGSWKLRRLTHGAARVALVHAYGEEGLGPLLRATYRKGPEAVATMIKKGILLGLNEGTAPDLARTFGMDEERLRQAIVYALSPPALEASPVAPLNSEPTTDTPTSPSLPSSAMLAHREVIARFEFAVGVRVEGAVAAAYASYAAWLQVSAGILALGGAYIVHRSYGTPETVMQALILGIAAVPLAPVSKDLLTFLRSATSALNARGRR